MSKLAFAALSGVLKIRPYTPADATEMRHLLDAVGRSTGTGAAGADLLSARLDGYERVRVAQIGGRLAGCCAWRDGGAASFIAVHPGWSGSGLEHLLRELVDRAAIRSSVAGAAA
jgi:GNAT superfamily N-acetyltransferase